MKKAEDEMRSEYKRSDFAKLECGKFYAEVVKGTTVVLLSPENAKAFPTSQAVNDALAGVLAHSKRASRISRRSTRIRTKAVERLAEHERNPDGVVSRDQVLAEARRR